MICLAMVCCKQKEKAATTKASPQYYIYAPRHDADFANGNPAFAATVLQVWKGYESGGFSSYKKYFADSVQMVFADEQIIGTATTVLNAWQKQREKITTTQCHVDFWKPVYIKNLNQQWVLIWGKHEGTTAGNNRDSWSVHQVWKFNAEGKIFFMQEYKSRFYW